MKFMTSFRHLFQLVVHCSILCSEATTTEEAKKMMSQNVARMDRVAHSCDSWEVISSRRWKSSKKMVVLRKTDTTSSRLQWKDVHFPVSYCIIENHGHLIYFFGCKIAQVLHLDISTNLGT